MLVAINIFIKQNLKKKYSYCSELKKQTGYINWKYFKTQYNCVNVKISHINENYIKQGYKDMKQNHPLTNNWQLLYKMQQHKTKQQSSNQQLQQQKSCI